MFTIILDQMKKTTYFVIGGTVFFGMLEKLGIEMNPVNRDMLLGRRTLRFRA